MFPVVNAIIGFQLRPIDKVIINIEGGLHTTPFIGMSIGYGGGGNELNHAVGFWGDFVVYSTTSGSSSDARFGDYVTTRRSIDGSRFSAEGYARTGSPAAYDPHYALFGR